MKLLSRYILFVLCIMSTYHVQARVFDFLPFFKSGGAVDINELLGDKRIMKEPVTVNGISTTLNVGIMDINLREYALKLKKINPKQKTSLSKNGLFYNEDLGNGKVKKHYLTQVSTEHPVIHFSMELPKDAPRKVSWPSSLPMPTSAAVDSTIIFDDRGTAYASFSSMLTADHAAQDVDSSLVSDGWQPMASPVAGRQSTAGGFFFKPAERKVLIVSFIEAKNGGTSGSIYMKPLKK